MKRGSRGSSPVMKRNPAGTLSYLTIFDNAILRNSSPEDGFQFSNLLVGTPHSTLEEWHVKYSMWHSKTLFKVRSLSKVIFIIQQIQDHILPRKFLMSGECLG